MSHCKLIGACLSVDIRLSFPFPRPLLRAWVRGYLICMLFICDNDFSMVTPSYSQKLVDNKNAIVLLLNYNVDVDYLTVTSICNKLDSISNRWITVAELLKVDYDVINSVMVSRFDDKSSLKNVVQWWFMNTTNPEWNTVIEVFDCIMEGKCDFYCVTASCIIYYLELRKVHV